MDILEYLVVVGPRWVGEVDGGRIVDFAVEFGQESTSKMDGTRS